MPQSGQRKKKQKGLGAGDSGIKGVDLFCGAGGLTRGLETANIDVSFGVDIDPDCEYPYQANNKANFLLKSVEDLTASDFSEAFGDAALSLLAGCAPCQTFSTYQQGKYGPSDKRWNLLQHV